MNAICVRCRRWVPLDAPLPAHGCCRACDALISDLIHDDITAALPRGGA